jgi:hypothetical protein
MMRNLAGNPIGDGRCCNSQDFLATSWIDALEVYILLLFSAEALLCITHHVQHLIDRDFAHQWLTNTIPLINNMDLDEQTNHQILTTCPAPTRPHFCRWMRIRSRSDNLWVYRKMWVIIEMSKTQVWQVLWNISLYDRVLISLGSQYGVLDI